MRQELKVEGAGMSAASVQLGKGKTDADNVSNKVGGPRIGAPPIPDEPPGAPPPPFPPLELLPA